MQVMWFMLPFLESGILGAGQRVPTAPGDQPLTLSTESLIRVAAFLLLGEEGALRNLLTGECNEASP